MAMAYCTTAHHDRIWPVEAQQRARAKNRKATEPQNEMENGEMREAGE